MFVFKIEHKLTSNDARKVDLVTAGWLGRLPPPPPPKKKKNIDLVSELPVVNCFRVNKTMSRSREFPCVFSSLVVHVKLNSNEDVEVTVYRSHSESYEVANRTVVF